MTNSMVDLDRSIVVNRMAVDACPDILNQAAYSNNLGYKLHRRYELTGEERDLIESCEITELAAETISSEHKGRADSLNNLGLCLSGRFERSGNMDDLNRAIEAAAEASRIASLDHQNRALFLNSLAKCLCVRFDWLNSIDDLDWGIEVIEKARDAISPGHRDHDLILSNLGNLLARRFKRTGQLKDLNRAIDALAIAVENTSLEDPDRPRWLNNFGAWLGTRFEVTGATEDLNRAIEVSTEAVTIHPASTRNKDRPSWYNNLGGWYYRRFEKQKDVEDLNKAIKYAVIAVEGTSVNHPDRATWLNNLGVQLETRFRNTHSSVDLEQAIAYYTEGWESKNAQPSLRIGLAIKAAKLIASQLDWNKSSSLLREAVLLFPSVSSRSLRHTDKEDVLAKFAGMASMAAAATLNAGGEAYDALKQLELSRGVIASILLDMRTDTSALDKEYPGLAKEFVSLREMLDSPEESPISTSLSDTTTSLELRTKQRREADERFSQIINTIRNKPGFGNFLLPPSAEELKAASDPDPIIVINLSSYRCDAFLINSDDIKIKKLPSLNLSLVSEWTRRLRSQGPSASHHTTKMLESLWDFVASPCLDALGFTDPISEGDTPRVWWITTGLLSQLPLHAAGKHALRCNETVIDRVMSSYASSIKSLIQGRQNQTSRVLKPRSKTALLVSMKETAGLTATHTLPFADAEVEMLNGLCQSLDLTSIEPGRRKHEVLEGLKSCSIFHFAGHGQSNPTEPSKSCLLLDDWETNPLTVEDLREHRLQDNPPFLGYLSACSTGVNESEKLMDEGIHLISAFQLAGFQHVIGTLWEVSDEHCVHVARVLYETIRDDGMTDLAVCRGLHRAVRALRDGRIEKVGDGRNAKVLGGIGKLAKDLTEHYWVPYVHFGVLSPPNLSLLTNL